MCITLAVLVTCVITVTSAADRCNSRINTFPWQPHWMPERDDLYCDNACEEYHKSMFTYDQLDQASTELDKCCTCYSCTSWTNEEIVLFIEYISVTGKSLVLFDVPFANSSVYEIEHVDEEMTEIPSNLCDWDADGRVIDTYAQEVLDSRPFWNNIVKIDFTGNDIRKIVDLNCLSRLDSLDLKNNKITYLTNTSLSNLTFLRNLDLSGNQIKGMDPAVLFSPNLNIFIANLTHNKLTELDITNGMLSNPFCEIDYSFNEVTDLINTLGFSLDQSRTYGPGLVSLANNAMEIFPDLKSLLNLKDLSEWGQLISFGFDLRGIKLNCNCNLEPFTDLAEDIRDTLWRDYFNVTCVTPPELRGTNAFYVDPLKLVCPIDVDSNCPKSCKCVDQPKTNTLFVDCAGINLKDLPKTLPDSDFTEYISLNVSGNQISSIPDLPYLNKLIDLDISGNIVEEISNQVAANLENATIDISNNIRLRKLPQTFQFRNICTTKMEHDVLDCTCDTIWMETWIQTKYSKNCMGSDTMFDCDVPEKGKISALNFERSMLTCEPDSTILYAILFTMAGVLLALIVGGVFIVKFRYELLVMWLRSKQTSLNKNIEGLKHDVVILLNEEDEKLRKWVTTKLYPILQNDGYRVFLPVKDATYGANRDSEMAENFIKSRSFLLVLTESYLEKPEDDGSEQKTENEWKYAWHQFRQDSNKNIVIVNYDHISSFDVDHLQIKAYLRVGHTVQFGNHENNVINEIKKKLGPPPAKSRGMENYKTVFNSRHVHQKTDKVLPPRLPPIFNPNCNKRFDPKNLPTQPIIKQLQEELDMKPTQDPVEEIQLLPGRDEQNVYKFSANNDTKAKEEQQIQIEEFDKISQAGSSTDQRSETSKSEHNSEIYTISGDKYRSNSKIAPLNSDLSLKTVKNYKEIELLFSCETNV